MASITFSPGTSNTFRSPGTHFGEVMVKELSQEKSSNPKTGSHKLKASSITAVDAKNSWKHFSKQVASLRKTVEDVVSQFEKPVLDGMVNFCRSEARRRETEEAPDLMSSVSFSLGSTPWSLTRLLQQLRSEIKENNIIVPLHSSAFSNIRRAVSICVGKCIAQLESGSHSSAHDGDKNIEEESFEPSASSSFGDLLDVFEQWKYSKRRGNEPAILLVFEDTEAFPRAVLAQFIQICALHYGRLPIIPLFGFLSSDAALPNVLSADVTGLLNVTSFRFPQPETYVDSLVELCIHHFAWKLDPALLRFVLSRMIDDYGSTQQFLAPLEFALFRKALNDPAFILCQKTETDKKISDSCTDSVISHILKSMNPDPGLKKKKERLQGALTDARKYYDNFSLCLQLLNVLLKDTSFDPHMHELYCSILEHNSLGEEIGTAMSAWRYWDIEISSQKLNGCIEVLQVFGKDTRDSLAAEILSQLEKFQLRFHHINETQEKYEEAQMKENGRESLSESLRGSNKRPTRNQLQDELKKRIQSKKADPSSELRGEFIRYITVTIQKYLCPPSESSIQQSSLESVNLFSLSWDKETEKLLETNHRDNFYRTITPQNESGSSEAEPDASIAFRLYKTCPLKTIDVSDWLTRFKEEIEGQQKTQKNEKSKTPKRAKAKANAPDSNLEGRFFVAVAELEWNGIVKGSDSKAGVVQRLFGVGIEESESTETGLAALDSSS